MSDYRDELAQIRRATAENAEAIDELGRLHYQTASVAIHYFDQVSTGLEEVNRKLEGLTHASRRSALEMKQLRAEMHERYSQLSGRMRLQDSRFDRMLGGVDHDQGDFRASLLDLERRVTELEKRRPA